LTKTTLIYSVSCFNFGGLGTLFGGDKPTNASPVRRDWYDVLTCKVEGGSPDQHLTRWGWLFWSTGLGCVAV